MEYKLLEEQDLELMLDFVDDENTKYSIKPCEEINKQIYNHWGFNEFVTSGTETYPDGTVITVEYYGKDI